MLLGAEQALKENALGVLLGEAINLATHPQHFATRVPIRMTGGSSSILSWDLLPLPYPSLTPALALGLFCFVHIFGFLQV